MSKASVPAVIAGSEDLSAKPRAKTPVLPPPPPHPEVFEIMEFCAWARVSRSVVFKEISKGRLIVRRVGRKSIVPIENAKAWLASLPTTRGA
jgi:hypothetical protein